MRETSKTNCNKAVNQELYGELAKLNEPFNKIEANTSVTYSPGPSQSKLTSPEKSNFNDFNDTNIKILMINPENRSK